jgi:signal transduction histidine kinase
VHANALIGALRVTYPTSFVDERIRRTWFVLAGVGAIVLGLVFLVSLRRGEVTKPLDALSRRPTLVRGSSRPSSVPRPAGDPRADRVVQPTAERLQALVTSQQAFVADASHQLRTRSPRYGALENSRGDRGHRRPGANMAARWPRSALATVDGLLELARASAA